MAVFRFFSRRHIFKGIHSDKNSMINNNYAPTVCIRMLNYSPVVYDEERDPAPLFFNKDVQALLRLLTRVDITKVYRKRKLGEKKSEDPEYKFMTDEQLDLAIKKAKRKMDRMLQMPPVIRVRIPVNKVLSRDPALQGLDTSRMVFTDITFGVKDSDRLIVVREPDGTLQEAEWDLRNRINQTYFPQKGRSIRPPKMFDDFYLENLLMRREYEFILDSACIHFEPNDLKYQNIVSIVYQHINDNNGFELLRSTRHFGVLTFFLVWKRNIDNLLLELIETAHIEEASKLVELYSKVHSLSIKNDHDLTMIEDYIKTYSNKKGALELGLQAYKELAKEREELDKGIKVAHGLS